MSARLTKNDARILDLLFNGKCNTRSAAEEMLGLATKSGSSPASVKAPEIPTGAAPTTAPQSRPPSPPPAAKNAPKKETCDHHHNVLASGLDVHRSQAGRLEAEGILAADAGDLATSLKLLEQALAALPADIAPCSILNNRAQVFRLQGDHKMALCDLDRAIALARASPGRPERPEILRQAHTQRGAVLKELGRDAEAFDAFAAGARHGNEFARMATAVQNPYAKLCGSTVAQVIANEIGTSQRNTPI